MKTMTALAGVLFAVAVAACSAGASAQPPQTSVAQGVGIAPDARDGRGHHDPAAFITRLDANKDGKLQVTELPERMKERLATADTDKDGVLSIAELTAHRAQAKQERFAKEDKNGDGALDASEIGDNAWSHLQVADANKDGKVTLAELDAARAAGTLGHGDHGKRGEGRAKPTPEAFIAKFDANKDGALQTSEIPERMRPWLEKADANKDGVLTKDELQAAHDAHQKERGDHGR